MSEIGIGSIVFTNWEIVELIGHGSFGSVYKIQRKQSYGKSSGAKVQYAALKVIYVPTDKQEIKRLRNKGMDHNSVQQYFQDSAERICREIDVMYPLKGHGNIVTYDDYDIIPQESGIGSIILIKMELLTSLNDYTLDTPMDEDHTIQLGIDLCQALDACEKKNIIHRDIKPDNIFVNDFGSFKLGDFGIARTADGTTTGTMTGTYGYIAPEVFNGKKYNQTVDIYSLGIVLYQYLNGGRLPFEPPIGQNITVKDFEMASAKRFSGKDIPKIEGIDPVLSNIICKACAYRSEDRYQSASELKEALLNYQRKTGGIGQKTSNEDRKPKEDYEKTVVLPDYKTEYAGKSNSETVGVEPNWKPSVDPQSQTLEAEQEWKKETGDNNKKADNNKIKAIGIFAAGVVVVGAAILAGQNLVNKSDNETQNTTEKQTEVTTTAQTTGKPTTTTTAEPTTTTTTIETTTTITTAPEPAYVPEVGDIVTFGTYEQDGNTSNGAEDIEWIVLNVQGDQALLISKYGLDAIPYNVGYVRITWKNCTLRHWLNNGFLNTAFTVDEQNGILLTTVVNDDNPNYGTRGGNHTEDYIFCLSLEEAGEYFDSDDARICNPTEYAIAQGAYSTDGSSSGSCWWWLRSPGANTDYAAYVSYYGALHSGGTYVYYDYDAVRPALWVEISNLES